MTYNVIVQTVHEANMVMQSFRAIQRKNNATTVADFKRLVDLDVVYYDHKNGWINPTIMSIGNVVGGVGYELILPDPVPVIWVPAT